MRADHSGGRMLLLLAGVVYCWSVATLPVAAEPRDVQIRMIDFEHGVIELFNFGENTIALDGWRFCTHDEDQSFIYSSFSGLNGRQIDPSQSLFVHYNNDAVGGNAINRSQLGALATTLDPGPYSIGLYFPPVFFSDGNQIADHIQWSIGGVDNLRADERSDEAENGGVWTDQSLWIPTTADTLRIELLDLTGGILHGPDDYRIVTPSIPGDHNGDGVVSLVDLSIVQTGMGIQFDRIDAAIVVRNLGTVTVASPAAGLVVPEPSTLTLATLGLLACTAGRRRRRR